MKGNFQLIMLVVFIALAIFGVLVFSGAIPIGNNDTPGSGGTVVLWGTVRGDAMAPLVEEFNLSNTSFTLKYVQKGNDTFDQDLLEALAAGTGPDLIILPDDLAFHYSNKIYQIPYQSFPLASFRSNFAGAGEVFLTEEGVVAFPLTIDPLVMYYNRSLLDAEGVVHPPATWDDLKALAPKLTKKDDSGKITVSAVALGHSSNVAHAKDILSALFLQTGNPIVKESNSVFISTIGSESKALPAALKFYTDFANPNEIVYSWNKSLPDSGAAFTAGEVAFYFGFASELQNLINKNPNENIGVASIPQLANTSSKTTMAHLRGIAVLSSSKNLTTALSAAGLLSSGNFASEFAAATGTAPARRDLLAQKKTDAFSPIFFNSAIYARSWLDPSPKSTDDIWKRMIDSVISGAATTDGSVSDAGSRLGLLLLR